MTREGPTLETLLRRLAETPEDFLAEPSLGQEGAVEVPAVVADLLRLLGAKPQGADLSVFLGLNPRRDRNRLGLVLVASWLLADEWFQTARLDGALVVALLRDDLAALAALTVVDKFVTDPERREELVRIALARLNLRPKGESVAQAQDRLTSLSSTERARVMQASQAALQRAREIRAALAKKAADESADKYTRE